MDDRQNIQHPQARPAARMRDLRTPSPVEEIANNELLNILRQSRQSPPSRLSAISWQSRPASASSNRTVRLEEIENIDGDGAFGLNLPANIPDEPDININDPIKDLKRKSLTKKLIKINTKIYNNLSNTEAVINKLVKKRFEIMINSFTEPQKTKSREFISKCKTNLDVITYEEMDIKQDDIHPVGFILDTDIKENELTNLHCTDKGALIRSMMSPMFKYRTQEAVYRLIYPDYWISQEGIITLLLSDKAVFKLVKSGDFNLGTMIGIGTWHGGVIRPVYDLVEVDVNL